MSNKTSGASSLKAGSKQMPNDRASSKNIRALRVIGPLLRPYRLLILATLTALIFTAGVTLTLPLAVRRVVDNFAGNPGLLEQYFLAAVGLAALMAGGSALRYALVSQLGEKVIADLREALFARMITMSPGFFERIMTGEILSRLTTDTTLLLSVIGSSASVALRNILMLSGGIVLMMLTSPKLTGMVLLVVPCVLVPILTLGRRLRRLSRITQEEIARSSGNASEALLAAHVIQAFSQENQASRRFSNVTRSSLEAAIARIKARAWLTAIVIFLIFTAILAVLWVGANDVRSGSMSAGELVQFVIYAVITAGSVAALSEIWGELQRAAGAAERVIELLDAEDEIPDPVNPISPPVFEGSIEFRDVHFTYPQRPNIPALNGVSFSVKPGETIALVGPSGAGKTTILQLLLRFFMPDSGEILLDGMPVHQLAREELRKAFALVPQEAVIFAMSAAENIGFGSVNANSDAIERAAKAAAADGFIRDLPSGYESELGERGVMLSGGQKQRVAIARAILRDAPILLLDEATSALDAESEQAVQNAIDGLAKSRTMIVIAHRLATVKRADLILVMDQGRIIASGTHESLVAEGGLYARLARLQLTDGNSS